MIQASNGEWLCEFGEHQTAQFYLMMDSRGRILLKETEQLLAEAIVTWLESDAYEAFLLQQGHQRWVSMPLAGTHEAAWVQTLGLRAVAEASDTYQRWYASPAVQVHVFPTWGKPAESQIWMYGENEATVKRAAQALK